VLAKACKERFKFRGCLSGERNERGERVAEMSSSTDWLVELGKLALEVAIIIGVVVSVAYAATGTWHLGFAVESGSMEPHMHVGDLIFVLSPSRTNITTYEEGKKIGYKTFGDYGDVIIYRPNGRNDVTPIIHRAMKWVEKGEEMPDGRPAPHAGYITKGDANPYADQVALLVGHERVQPVKPEWIIGVARARVPFLGYPSIALRKILPFLCLRPSFCVPS